MGNMYIGLNENEILTVTVIENEVTWTVSFLFLKDSTLLDDFKMGKSFYYFHFSNYFFFQVVYFPSYFMFSTAALPHSPGVVYSIAEERDQKSWGCPLLFSKRTLGSFCE